MAKRGPKTKAGKAAIRLNAMRHGVLMTTIVVPGLERQEDWEAHRDAIISSLAAEGYMERLLAERIAQIYWRLQRIVRHETEMVTLAQENIEEQINREYTHDASHPGAIYSDVRHPILTSAKELRELLTDVERRITSLRKAQELADDTLVAADDAVRIILTYMQADQAQPENIVWPIELQQSNWETHEQWTGKLLHETIRALSSSVGMDQNAFFTKLSYSLQALEEKLRIDLHQLVVLEDRLRRQHLLPDSSELEKATRYEAHLNRQLYQAMHELEALQARRHGQHAPLARLDIQALPET